jgi:hypothetical protein
MSKEADPGQDRGQARRVPLTRPDTLHRVGEDKAPLL